MEMRGMVSLIRIIFNCFWRIFSGDCDFLPVAELPVMF